MRIAVPKENVAGERRVPIVPESVKRLAAKKIDVSIEAGAGLESRVSDEEYRAMGATIEPGIEPLVANADVVVRLRVPTLEEIGKLKEGSALVSPLFPLINPDLVKALAARKVTSI